VVPRTRPKTKTTTRKTTRPTAKVDTKASRAEKAARRRRLREFRKRLFERQQVLMQSYTNNKDTRMPNVDGTEDYIDYAVSSYDRDFMLSLSEMDRHQLRLVEEALIRIDRGEFGRCLQCSVDIPVKRLEVEPWARHCIRCQELDEQGLLEDIESEVDSEEDEAGIDQQTPPGKATDPGDADVEKGEADLEDDEYEAEEVDEDTELAR
jgi:DnaK suppressor protein